VKCFNCSEKGHFARECPKKKSENRLNGKDQDKTRDCAFMAYNKVREKGANSEKPRRANSLNEHVRRLLEEDASEVWLADSGVSAHITHRRDWLKNYRLRKSGTLQHYWRRNSTYKNADRW